MILQRIVRFLKDKKGISTSLVEAGAVISIGVALAAAFAPSAVKQATKGEDTRALSDVSSIKQMATSFQADTGKFMAYEEGTVTVLISGTPTSYPITAGSVPTGTGICPTTITQGTGVSTTAVTVLTNAICGNINHYLFDSRSLPTTYEDVNVPYGPEMPVDPWGNPYMVYIDPFRPLPGTGTVGDGTVNQVGEGWGWVISAGENGVLETDIDDDAAGGDDVALVMEFRNKP